MARRVNPELLAELRSTGRAKDQILGDIAESLCELEETTKRLHNAVIGDNEAGHTGLIEKTRKHHERIGRLERIVLWGGGALAAVSLFWESFKIKIFPH